MSEGGSWTPAEVPDLDGRTIVVTGANSGIGLEATRQFVENGAHVVMACRSVERGERAAAEVDGRGSTEVLELDLASLDSVRAFVETFEAAHEELHVLVNNAGVMFVPFSHTEENFETQFGVNHLGHFALTGLLLDRLVSTTGDRRVVTVSSGYHRRSDRTEFGTVHDRTTYDKGDAYSDSKLANVLFAQELQRRLLEADHDVKSVACHPGWAATNLQSRGPRAEGSRLKLLATQVANRVFAQSAEQGAWPTVYAATSPAVHGGEYVGPSGFMSMRGTPEIQTASDRANDPDLARRLWERSEEWTDVEFGLPAQGTGAAGSDEGGDTGGTGVGGTAD